MASPITDRGPQLGHSRSVPQQATLPFIYQSLDVSKNEIRLLQIAPSVETNNIICGTLDYVSLDHHLSYDALSYTWADDIGDDSHDHVMLLNGHCFKITHNLSAALRQLRLRTSNRVFWVDAICINQNDFVERSQQVGKMKAIYAGAARVISWVGEEYDRSKAAFELFHDLPKYDSLEKWYEKVYGAGNEPSAESEVTAIIEAVLLLFGRRYWSRVWVLQELAFAKNILVACGRDSVSWTALQANCTRFKRAEPFLDYVFGGTHTGHIVQNLQKTGPNTMDRFTHSDNQVLADLGTLLAKHRYKFATDPKDKVYSLLGMASNVNQQNFQVDYNLDTIHIYRETAKFLIINQQTLEFLGENKLPPSKSLLPLPSWVADWTNANGSMSNPISFYGPYRASGSSTAEATVNSNSNSISAKGTCIGTVTSSSIQLAGFNPRVFDFLPVFTLLYEWWKLYLSTGRTAIVGPGSFVDIVSMGYWYTQFDAQQLAHATEWFLKNFAIVLRKYMDNFPPLDNTLQALIDAAGEPAEGFVLRRAESEIWETAPRCRDRRLFVSDRDAIGIGPQCMDAGDLICVFMGCSVPVILRRVAGMEEHYINLGDAYVHGFMNGEVLSGLESGKYKTEVFDIS